MDSGAIYDKISNSSAIACIMDESYLYEQHFVQAMDRMPDYEQSQLPDSGKAPQVRFCEWCGLNC